jgi:hypothetical protein
MSINQKMNIMLCDIVIFMGYYFSTSVSFRQYDDNDFKVIYDDAANYWEDTEYGLKEYKIYMLADIVIGEYIKVPHVST